MADTSLLAPFTFYTNTEYWVALTGFIKSTQRGDRILLMSMTLEPTEPEIAKVLHEIELAAARGVTVNIAIDAHSFLLNPSHLPGPLWSRRKLSEKLPRYYLNKLRAIEKINAYPTAHADIINIPSRRYSLPVVGRSHIKAAIINDDVFIGGCNLEQGKRMDLMAHWQSRDDAERLYALLTQVIHGKQTSTVLAGIDRRMAISGGNQLLIDAGTKRQSIIFDEAMNMIDSAEKWLVITCQYFPNSITAKHLVAAMRRGVKVEVLYSHPHHHGLIGGFGQHVNILRERTRVPRSLFKDGLSRKEPMLHAKLIACDKGIMLGSHNYVRAGVLLGTAEIALKSSDIGLAREAVKSLHRGLKKSI
jgi:phosphatidylserine/phosphatidylglycerophosphate/cardiolipin synthase-like enzyme